ncbi:Uncharacterized protein Adt_12132 [Abeliophyllum distichum]|uniref:Transposase (putative) gypsy type domain-containing protein n=1 Tax=Abeliophyllum distichum TaxID=126358 RepID=A0ABD1UQU8_9LAMI
MGIPLPVCGVPVGEALDECRVPVGEALGECRVPVGEALDECRVPMGEALDEACYLQNKFEEIILEQKRRIFFKVSDESYLRQLFRSCLRGIGGDNTGCGGGEASSHVLPVLEGVLPIRGVDGSTGEAIPMGPISGLREVDDPYRADVVRWAAMDVPSIMVEEDLTKLREEYRIPEDIELILPGPNERACFPRCGCTALHLNAFVSGMRLPLHPMFRRILRAYDLAPTQVAPNGWSQMVGGMYLWFCHSFGLEMPLHRVYDDPEPDLNVPSVYGIASPLPRCELSRENIDVLRSIYEADSKSRSYSFIMNRQRCLVELGLVASKAEMDQGRRPRPTLAKLAKQRPRTLVPGCAEDTSQRKAIERWRFLCPGRGKRNPSRPGLLRRGRGAVDVDNTVCGVPPLQRTLTVNQSGEVVLEGPSRPTPTLGSGDGDPFDSKRRLRELIGAPGARIPDDAFRSVPFYPSMGAQAVKKYFTPKWEEFLFPRRVGRRAGSQPGLSNADEGPG